MSVVKPKPKLLKPVTTGTKKQTNKMDQSEQIQVSSVKRGKTPTSHN